MQIQAKTRKCKNRTISETVNPIKPKLEYIAATINYTSWTSQLRHLLSDHRQRSSAALL